MRVAVVDLDPVGRNLPAALAKHGLDTVRVWSQPPSGPFDAADIIHRGDLAETVAALRQHDIGFVLAGKERGVILADELSHALGTPGNGMTRPAARRDKYEMALAVGEAGLAVAASFASPDADELTEWAQRLGTWPVVLKPLDSSGTDNVRICRSLAEVRAGHAAIMASANRFGIPNQNVLAQEFLDGDEYFVNTVTRDGVHHVVEVWRYFKRSIPGGHWMYDHEEPVPMETPGVAGLVDYTLAVLDALEVRNAAAHTEVMLTARGPVLVESAARLGGSHNQDIVAHCIGTNQVECLALAVARPDEVTGRRLPSYQLRTALRYVTLISPGDGVVPDEAGFAAVRSLRSFVDIVLTTPAGVAVRRTVDLDSSPGYVYLESDDPRQVEEDYQLLRRLEETGLYTKQSPTSKAVNT